ncbi:hypothetical protein C0995_002993 [Termitomyces sp. Mi166|nr:hypothetical protein C0995_002993 [Termitomyces sp. Mi166\
MSVLSSDSSNPSVPERIICHRWEGTKYSSANGNFSQWTEKLKDTLILNGLLYSPQQKHSDTPCDPTNICLLMENAQNIINAKTKSVQAMALSVKGGGKHCDTDLPGHNHGPGATCCENCFSLKCPCWGHTKPFCIQKGGGMAGKSIAESQEAKRAQRKKADMQKGTPDKPTTSAKSFVAITGLDGKLWYVDLTQLGQLPFPPETASFANVATSYEEPHLNQSTEYWEHVGVHGDR